MGQRAAARQGLTRIAQLREHIVLRSFLSGSTLGILLSGTAAIGVSLLFPAPAGNEAPSLPQMEIASANVDPSGDRDVAALAVVTDPPKVDDAPVAAVEPEVSVDPDAMSEPLDEPQTAAVDDVMVAPDTSGAVSVATSTEDPVLPNPQSLSLQAPSSETQVSVSTEPALAPVEPVLVDDVPVQIPTEEVAVAETEIVPEDPPELDVVSDVPLDEQQETFVESAPEVVAPIDENPSAQATSPTIISIVTDDGLSLPSGNGAVQVNRPAGEENAPNEAVEAGEGQQVAVDPNAPAITQFAAKFENPEAKQLMSIVLHDRGEIANPLLSLERLDFPVTIVLDPAARDVVSRMDLYRDAGFEVAVMVDFPVGARPSDVEITLGSVFAELTDAVALIDTGESGLQADRDVIEQAMAVLAADGRGFLTISRGLNTALRAADDLGVPATTIYRDIDPEWHSARVINRFLDQSAFRARQQSGVVLFGRIRPNTLSALKSWSRSSRAEQIAIAPLSAVLTELAN